MAKESACRLQMGKDRHDGDVRMEADHIDFAGATKYRFRIAELTNPRRDGDAIKFSFHGNPVAIALETVELAKDWIAYIQNPQTLADAGLIGSAKGKVKINLSFLGRMLVKGYI